MAQRREQGARRASNTHHPPHHIPYSHSNRIRRIKCDEAKPSCLKCSSTGRRCEGYTQDLADSKSDDRRAVAVIQRLSINIPGSTRERRGFQYFTTRTAPELTGYYETITFWQKLILQASSVDSSIRHAVIAIGTLHEEFANNRWSYYAQTASKGVDFATGQYSKAIAHLRKSLVQGKQTPVTALLSCILFVCFDSLRGHFDAALVHLKSGLKILKAVDLGATDVVLTQISPIFKRLSLQAILYVDTRPTLERRSLVKALADVSFREEQIPEVFESLAQARHCLNQSADGLFRSFYQCEGHLPMSQQDRSALETQSYYTNLLVAWNVAYERFMHENAEHLSGKELRGAALLKIHHISASIMAKMAGNFNDPRSVGDVMNDNSAFVAFRDEFKIITNLAGTLIKAAELDLEREQTSLTFSTDLGLIGPLYYVCIRCQDHSVRQEAMALLLRCPRREGMWDTEAVAKMVNEFWEFERKHKSALHDKRIVVADLVDLVFDVEKRWTWKWKDPMRMTDMNDSTSRDSSHSGTLTPGSL